MMPYTKRKMKEKTAQLPAKQINSKLQISNYKYKKYNIVYCLWFGACNLLF